MTDRKICANLSKIYKARKMIGNKYVQIGVMGPGASASKNEVNLAYLVGLTLGKEEDFALISGGMETGTMHASLTGFRDSGGQNRSVAILSSRGERASNNSGIVIPTGIGSGRNYLNIVASDIIVVIGDLSDPGTLSEVALKLARDKDLDYPTVILVGSGGKMVAALLDTFPEKVVWVEDHKQLVSKIKSLRGKL